MPDFWSKNKFEMEKILIPKKPTTDLKIELMLCKRIVYRETDTPLEPEPGLSEQPCWVAMVGVHTGTVRVYLVRSNLVRSPVVR